MTNEEQIHNGLADMTVIVEELRGATERALQLSAVTKSKAAETDRLTDENRALHRQVEDLEAQKVDIDNACEAKLRAMRDELAEHKRLAQEKVDALEELLSKANLPEEQPEAPKSPAVDVIPGPDYVTRAELVRAMRHCGGHSFADALERKP